MSYDKEIKRYHRFSKMFMKKLIDWHGFKIKH